MSYILSALRKAESERQNPDPGVSQRMKAPQPEPVANNTDNRKVYALVVVGALLIAGAGLWFFGEEKSVSSGYVDAAPPVSLSLPASEPAMASAEPIIEHRAVPGIEQEIQRNPEPARYQPERESTPVYARAGENSTDSFVQQKPLPAALPAINITGYIYFESNPDNSKLFVDGIVYRLGSRVARGVTIKNFYPDHIEVLHQGVSRDVKIP